MPQAINIRTRFRLTHLFGHIQAVPVVCCGRVSSNSVRVLTVNSSVVSERIVDGLKENSALIYFIYRKFNRKYGHRPQKKLVLTTWPLTYHTLIIKHYITLPNNMSHSNFGVYGKSTLLQDVENTTLTMIYIYIYTYIYMYIYIYIYTVRNSFCLQIAYNKYNFVCKSLFRHTFQLPKTRIQRWNITCTGNRI